MKHQFEKFEPKKFETDPGITFQWTEDGNWLFMGVPHSALFWLSPSMKSILTPLREEVGSKLFFYTIAYQAAKGTHEDYHAVINHLGKNFDEGIRNWSRVVARIGWGVMCVNSIDWDKKEAFITFRNPWEISVFKAKELQENTPFINGKLSGMFSYAFETNCRTSIIDMYKDAEGNNIVSYQIKASWKTLEEELVVLNKETSLGTDLKVLNKAFKESQKRFMDVLDTVGEFIWETDRFKNITFYTKKMADMLAKQDDLKGMKITDFIKEEYIDILNEKFSQIENGEKGIIELECLMTGTTEKWILLRAIPIYNLSEHVDGFRGSGEDITQRKEMEQKVEDRTLALEKRTAEVVKQKQEILEKNEELNQQNEEIQATADSLQKANDEITNKNNQITASVIYAKNIQTAILPLDEIMSKYLKYFILFRPKDIVSGDFYWFTNLPAKDEFSEKKFIAAVDCTGHGVPGAFMSMIGMQLLNKIVNQDKTISPADILLQLHNGIYESLKQATSSNTDGMDVCLCCIESENTQQFKITFSGAKRPLYYFEKEKNKLTRIKGDRKTIGGKIRINSLTHFSNKEIVLQKNDLLYLTTDGYVDQNNKERQKIGSPKLKEILNNIANKQLMEQKQILETELDNWQSEEIQRDDITVVGIKL